MIFGTNLGFFVLKKSVLLNSPSGYTVYTVYVCERFVLQHFCTNIFICLDIYVRLDIYRVTIPCLFLRFVIIFKGTVLEK